MARYRKEKNTRCTYGPLQQYPVIHAYAKTRYSLQNHMARYERSPYAGLPEELYEVRRGHNVGIYVWLNAARSWKQRYFVLFIQTDRRPSEESGTNGKYAPPISRFVINQSGLAHVQLHNAAVRGGKSCIAAALLAYNKVVHTIRVFQPGFWYCGGVIRLALFRGVATFSERNTLVRAFGFTSSYANMRRARTIAHVKCSETITTRSREKQLTRYARAGPSKVLT